MLTVNRTMSVCLVYCPESSGFTHDNGSGTCFRLVKQTVDWSTANSECNEHPRAHLVVINDNMKQVAARTFIDGEDKNQSPGCFL